MRTFRAFILVIAGIVSATFVKAQAPTIIPSEHPGIMGLWEFDHASDLTNATTGNNLILTGSQTAIAGPTAGDSAVRIGVGSYYTCNHDIAANGGGSDVNEYSLVFDFRVANTSSWHCFYQANETNSNDGELFINTSGQIGRSTLGPGYSTYQVAASEWYRMVVSVDLGNFCRVYLDGALVLAGGSLSVDGEYGIYAASAQNLVHFFADNNGEDGEIDIALAAIFDHPLNQTEVDSLGGYGHTIDPILTGIFPYLQTPTPTSIYVSWHSTQTSSTSVQYGTTAALGLTQSGSVDDISGKKWHTVKLTGLSANTEYFYKCISGTEESEVYKFRTPPASPLPGQHLRFILLGDSRTDIAKTTEIANAARNKAIEFYGADIHNHINLVVNVGDIVTSGSIISQYENEYFNPYASLSRYIPCMVIIGNHENESANFYDYMQYDDFSDYAVPLAERFYSFYYLNTQFLFVNGNTALQNSVQTTWVQQKLDQSASNADVDMVFCFTHQPGHSEIWPDGNTAYIQNDIIPLLQQYDKVQLLAYGHSHNYERGTLESKATVTNGDFYVMLTGGAGSALDRWGMYPNQQDYDEIMIALDHYLFNIVDIDLDNRSFELFTFSLGNNDKPLNCELVDYVYRKLDQTAPEKPDALSPATESGTLPLLVASEFVGIDSLMSSKFQVTATPGDYSSVVYEKRRDWVNIYGDSGSPDYIPTDLNTGIDLRRIQLTSQLVNGNQYGWRVAFRDHNQKWSDWSDEKTFTVNQSITAYTDFAANITQGNAPLTIAFTDLSYPAATSWSWDFENDGTDDSNIRDPEFTYTVPGFYTVKLSTANGVETKDLYINVADSTVQIIENKSTDILRINPNPCVTGTNIEFYLKEAGVARICIVDVAGKIVATLHDGEMAAGKHNITWEISAETGEGIPAGNYFVKFESKNLQEVKKIVVARK
ncbi:MAG: metallophosphoesterase [Bacteroidetes bacterium]|nr:metallophosphoesterase [Bacteroidota bacterium]MBU1720403.1 metallophosphoesterase [Bacteroidota bacterium]